MVAASPGDALPGEIFPLQDISEEPERSVEVSRRLPSTSSSGFSSQGSVVRAAPRLSPIPSQDHTISLAIDIGKEGMGNSDVGVIGGAGGGSSKSVVHLEGEGGSLGDSVPPPSLSDIPSMEGVVRGEGALLGVIRQGTSVSSVSSVGSFTFQVTLNQRTEECIQMLRMCQGTAGVKADEDHNSVNQKMGNQSQGGTWARLQGRTRFRGTPFRRGGNSAACAPPTPREACRCPPNLSPVFLQTQLESRHTGDWRILCLRWSCTNSSKFLLILVVFLSLCLKYCCSGRPLPNRVFRRLPTDVDERAGSTSCNAWLTSHPLF